VGYPDNVLAADERVVSPEAQMNRVVAADRMVGSHDLD
jgi:hypothetical protein